MPSASLRGNFKASKWLYSSPPVEWLILKLQETLIAALRTGPIPEHVAFVMDGNRRFARQSHIETTEGHNMGFEALARILEVCYKSGVKVVTIYAFSIENFKRSKYEVDALMDIAKIKLSQLAQHGDLLDRYGASIRILGHRSLVSPDVLEAIDKATEMTKHNRKAILNVCFPYTSRDEITTSIKSIVSLATPVQQTSNNGNMTSAASKPSQPLEALQEETETETNAPTSRPHSPSLSSSSSNTTSSSTIVSTTTPSSPSHNVATTKDIERPTAAQLSTGLNASGTPLLDIESITEQTLTDHMFTADNPPLDLLVRTSGVERMSDFMLWQAHQDTDIEFVDCMWPEFDIWHFLPILLSWGLKRKKFVAEEADKETRRKNEGKGWARGWDSRTKVE